MEAVDCWGVCHNSGDALSAMRGSCATALRRTQRSLDLVGPSVRHDLLRSEKRRYLSFVQARRCLARPSRPSKTSLDVANRFCESCAQLSHNGLSTKKRSLWAEWQLRVYGACGGVFYVPRRRGACARSSKR